MSINISKHLVHTATLWTASHDGYGGDTFGAPTLIKCRWENRQEIFRGPTDSRELISQAVVFTDRDVSIGDYLCEGDQSAISNPSELQGAFKVQRFDRVTDLRNADILRRATL